MLKALVTYLIFGPDVKRGNDRYNSNSICQNIVYAANAGREKTAKHLHMGMVINQTFDWGQKGH